MVVMMLAANKGGMVASLVSLMMFFILLKKPAQALAVSLGFGIILALAIAFTRWSVWRNIARRATRVPSLAEPISGLQLAANQVAPHSARDTAPPILVG